MKSVKLIVALAAMSVASAYGADDSMILWQLDSPNYNGESLAFDYATITALSSGGGSSVLSTYQDGVDVGSGVLFGSTDSIKSGYFDANSVEGFLVELWSDSTTSGSSPTVVGWQTYATSLVEKSIFTNNGLPATKVLMVSSVAPEPTSGLLLLFGVAGLALRRRRQTA